MFEGFSENEISNTNGLSSNDKCKSSTSEEEGTVREDEGDSSVSETFGMEPYLFEPVTAIDLLGSESASEEDPGEAIWRLANSTWYIFEL